MTRLTQQKIQKAQPKNKAYTLNDGGGLFLNIYISGAKHWYCRYTWRGKQSKKSLGTYPDVSLKNARNLHAQAKAYISQGIDPKPIQIGGQSAAKPIPFHEFVQSWLERKLKKLQPAVSKEKKHQGRQSTGIIIERYLRIDILPLLGHKSLQDITRQDVLAVQTKIEARGALSIAEKVRSWLDDIFAHVVSSGLIPFNPAADLGVWALPYRRNQHYPFLHSNEIPALMAKLNHYNGSRQVWLGLKLLLLTGVRQAELRFAKAQHFDLNNAIWHIPPQNVKQLQKVLRQQNAKIPDYLVPLPKQALHIIQELKSMMFTGQRYLLCHRSQPQQAISENTFNIALKRIGFHTRLTGHGIRATLSTALHEIGYNSEWIHSQLSHKGQDCDTPHFFAKRKDTYNHAKYIEPRAKMMQDWADRLDAWEQEGLEALAQGGYEK